MSTWLTLATILTTQMYPSKTLENLVPVPSADAIQFVGAIAPQIIAPCLETMNGSEAMEAVRLLRHLSVTLR